MIHNDFSYFGSSCYGIKSLNGHDAQEDFVFDLKYAKNRFPRLYLLSNVV